MDITQALFVPKNFAGGYKVALRIIKSGEDRKDCRIYLEPKPGDDYYLTGDFQLLMNLDEERNFPIIVGLVKVSRGKAPEHELEFERGGSELNFEEAVRFMMTMTRWKRVI